MQLVGQSKRLPIYLVIDVSGSMSGAPIEAVNNGLRAFEEAIKKDAHALETAHVSILTFETHAAVYTPLAPAGSFTAPKLTTGGSTSLGEAIELLAKTIDADVKPKGADHPGDWKPLVFLFTDGAPTDAWKPALEAFKRRQQLKPANIYAIGCGPGVATNVLREITENVMVAPDLTGENITSLFKWISQSATTASRLVSNRAAQGGAPAAAPVGTMPPAPPGFQVAF